MNEILTYLFNLALENHIAVEATNKLQPHTPSLAISDQRKIIINMNWYNQKELPFQIAHEISHLLNNDEGVQYYSSFSNKMELEGNANATAIDLLINYYCKMISDEWINPVTFMKHFGIPSNLEYLVTDKIYNAFGI